MKKRIISFALIGALFISVLPISAHADTVSELTIGSSLPKYDSIGAFSDGVAVVTKDINGDGCPEYGLINTNGDEIIPPKYDRMGNISDGIIMVGMDLDENYSTGDHFYSKGIDKYGFVDITGNEIVPLIYDAVEDFSDGMAVVAKSYKEPSDIFPGVEITKYKYGFVDKTGQEVIPLIYDSVSGVEVVGNMGGLGDIITTQRGFSEGLASVKNKDDKWGVIDNQGNTVVSFAYDEIGGFSEGLASVCVNGKFGYIDKQGKMVIPAVYDSVHDFSEGFACVGKADISAVTGYLRGFIDKQGTLIVDMKYEALGAKFCEGLVKVATASRDSSGGWTGWKWGFLNTNGDIAVPMIYYSVNMFSEGLSVVDLPEGWTGSASSAKTDKYGVIDQQGNIVIPLQSEYIGSFSEGLAPVGSPIFPKYHYIDRSGTTVIPKTANQYGVSAFSDGVAVAYDKKSGKYSIIKNPLSTSQTPATPTDTTPFFTDVPADDYYARAVAWAVENNITSGTSSTTFSPDTTCTTAQILTFLWRSQGKPEPTIKNPFADISENDYFYKAALWANEKGLVSGPLFDGDTPCSRAMVVAYLWKLAGSPFAPAASFTDVPDNSEYAPAVAWAVQQGITSGTSATKFTPAQTCSRGQIVTFLYRAYGK